MLKQLGGFECKPEERFVFYARNKSKVYGEFLLWQMTAQGLRWAVTRHDEVCTKLGLERQPLLLTHQGQPFYRRTDGNKNRSQIFANKWSRLIRRIQKDHPEFPKYSFGCLRDTAANLVRQISDGEIAAVFLMHGQPVSKDDLLDIYTNRPFARVFQALRQLEQMLTPVFAAAPEDPWCQPQQQYTTLSKRERILELSTSGLRPLEIAEQVGVSKMTVLRLLQRIEREKAQRKLQRST
eukprot:TRINITY_DN2926_c0_g1_i14.p1 TRINITY_DN2926_c0_g1~~TRINITY_DN2926_c0_g1_i14.p1  ORF type:complete len:238 (+),score=31.24 TRINITY_DN2926_c0_g1_i14:269-982(+)